MITLPSTVRPHNVALAIVRSHGIASLTDARMAGVFYACPVCYTIGGVDPCESGHFTRADWLAWTGATMEENRARTRDVLVLDCCGIPSIRI